MFDPEDIRCLPYYLIPKDWKVHLINPKTDEKQLEHIEELIENARLFAFDTETMPSFYQSFQKNSRPSLLQVAIRDQTHHNKNVLLFDLQEFFDQSQPYFRSCPTGPSIDRLIQLIFNHSDAIKLSQSLFNDLAYLKCSYDEKCFHHSKLDHLIELSDLYRRVFPKEKDQPIYGLQRMTAMTLHCQLDKKQQCANWSKRPLMQSLKDYAAIDVIVMIDIYERLKRRLEQEEQWKLVRDAILTSLDMNQILIYPCPCGEQFITNKARNKHARTCSQVQLEPEPHTPRGRGYIPPALKHLYQPIRLSSSKSSQDNRPPPDAQYFLEDDDSEVAQAFGLALEKIKAKPKIETQITLPKHNLKIAAYPPKINSTSEMMMKNGSDEHDLLDRLQDDFDSQPEFHCHLFGLGGRGRSLSTNFSPREPSFPRRHDYR